MLFLHHSSDVGFDLQILYHHRDPSHRRHKHSFLLRIFERYLPYLHSCNLFLDYECPEREPESFFISNLWCNFERKRYRRKFLIFSLLLHLYSLQFLYYLFQHDSSDLTFLNLIFLYSDLKISIYRFCLMIAGINCFYCMIFYYIMIVFVDFITRTFYISGRLQVSLNLVTYVFILSVNL